MTTTDPPADAAQVHHVGPGMRLSSRILLVLVALAIYALSVRVMLQPNLNSHFAMVGDIPLHYAIPWLVLFILLALQVSAKVSPGLIALLMLILLIAPTLTGFAAREVYSQFVMERTTATVVEVRKPSSGGPVPMTLQFPDGTTGPGYSTTGYAGSGTYNYMIPNVGSTVTVLRDPTGRLPSRTAYDGQAEPKGDKAAKGWGLLGASLTLSTLAICLNVVTRRRSFITDTAHKNAIIRAGD